MLLAIDEQLELSSLCQLSMKIDVLTQDPDWRRSYPGRDST